MVKANILTYIAILLIVIFSIYIYFLNLYNKSNYSQLRENLTLYSPFCANKSERQCVESPGCEWVIDDNYGRCRSKTQWYNPWYGGWYNWYNSYWVPWRWSYPYYRSYYSYPRNSYYFRYPRWRHYTRRYPKWKKKRYYKH